MSIILNVRIVTLTHHYYYYYTSRFPSTWLLQPGVLQEPLIWDHSPQSRLPRSTRLCRWFFVPTPKAAASDQSFALLLRLRSQPLTNSSPIYYGGVTSLKNSVTHNGRSTSLKTINPASSCSSKNRATSTPNRVTFESNGLSFGKNTLSARWNYAFALHKTCWLTYSPNL